MVAAFLAASCATTMTVSSHVERGLDFAKFRTYEWGPADALPTGDPRLDGNPFFKDHVQGAVEKQLAGRGLGLVTPGASPDLLIHYHANITRRLDANRLDRAYGYCYADGCPGGVIEYEAGTLVLDIIDASTSKLIWRGWAQNSVEDMLDNPAVMAATIEQAVTRMLQKLPRTL
jgi:hypothetical protein